jgi:hypothetical protein
MISNIGNIHCLSVKISTKLGDERHMEELLMYIKAMVYLQAQCLPDIEQKAKPEVLLARAGLKYAEIALILGKSEAAISKSISRAK